MSIFNKVKLQKPRRNKFNLSHDVKGTMNMGELIPIMCQEVIPSDKFFINTQQVMRMAPMLAPIMHKIDVYTHFFFVPNRILWNNSENFFTGGENGQMTPVYPTVDLNTNTNPASGYPSTYDGLIADYLGMPSIDANEPVYPGDMLQGARRVTVSALPFAALGKVWNEYYRDQNLQQELNIDLNDGDNTDLLTFAKLIGPESKPLKRAWKHDYFTSNLPFAQKGDSVTLPLTGDAPVEATSDLVGDINFIGDTVPDRVVGTDGSESAGDLNSSGSGQFLRGSQTAMMDNSRHLRSNSSIDDLNNAGLIARLQNATSATINDLRTAIRLQEWLERNARAGSRYSEFLKAHFGVRSSDARLQRPEYLGGSKNPIVISEILQTSATQEQPTPQGNMSGHGLGLGGSKGFNYYSEEHGWIIGLMSVLPRADYYQGVPRQFTKFNRLEHYYPTFAHLGEQGTKNKEVFATGFIRSASNDPDPEEDETFGYLPRYAEYRYIPNKIHGQFRSSLDFWTMARKFENRPTLNREFIEADPTKRVFAVELPEWEGLYYHVQLNVTALRPLPYFGTPLL